MSIYKQFGIECEDAKINGLDHRPFVPDYFKEDAMKNGSANRSRKNGKTGISVRNMSYDEAEEIVRGFQRTGPYLVQLASKYVPKNQVSDVMNYNNLSPKEFGQFLRIGNVVRGKAKKISNSRK